MTDKKLKVGNTAYTELSIQIGVLEAKVDKILEVLLLQEQPEDYSTYPLNTEFMSNEKFDEEFK